MGHGGSSKLVPCWNTDLTWPNLLMFQEMSEIWIFVKFLDYKKKKMGEGPNRNHPWPKFCTKAKFAICGLDHGFPKCVLQVPFPSCVVKK